MKNKFDIDFLKKISNLDHESYIYQIQKLKIYDKNFIKKNKFTTVLKEFVTILKKNHFKNFFLSGGSLLGVLRDGDFLPWDNDIDFETLGNSLRRFKNILINEFFNKGFLVRVKKNRSYIKINFFKNGCKISLSGYEIKNKEYLVSKINKIPSLFFKNLKEIEYKKIMLNVPSQPEKYLEYVYKDWKIKNNSKFYYNLKYYRHDTLYTFFFKMRRILHLNGD
jgi:phosphorylcholine metabolism protein LicD